MHYYSFTMWSLTRSIVCDDSFNYSTFQIYDMEHDSRAADCRDACDYLARECRGRRSSALVCMCVCMCVCVRAYVFVCVCE